MPNISKYAQASEVRIVIGSSATAIELRISDNGSGFTPSHNTTGFGLQGMRERVLSLQGTFEIVSSDHQGCQIVAVIPLRDNLFQVRVRGYLLGLGCVINTEVQIGYRSVHRGFALSLSKGRFYL